MTTTAMDLVKDAASQLEQVSPATANDERTAGRAVFVDVREAEEWQHGHIEGSVPAPRGLLEFFADPTSPRHKKELDPSRRVIMVCASGAPRVTGRHDDEVDRLPGRRRPRRWTQGLDGSRPADL